MSRLLKFRAFNTTTKKLFPAGKFELFQTEKGLLALQDGPKGPDSTLSEFLELSQFTGLLDSQKNEIYEGDIVETELDTTRKYLILISWNGVVPFHTDSIDPNAVNPKPVLVNFGRMGIHKTTGAFVAVDFKVIGNIFETPGLFAVEEKEKSRIILP